MPWSKHPQESFDFSSSRPLLSAKDFDLEPCSELRLRFSWNYDGMDSA
jgi:hypothetical protein